MIGGLSKNATLFEASGSTDLKDDILRRPVPVAKQLLHKDRYSLLRGSQKDCFTAVGHCSRRILEHRKTKQGTNQPDGHHLHVRSSSIVEVVTKLDLVQACDQYDIIMVFDDLHRYVEAIWRGRGQIEDRTKNKISAHSFIHQ